MESKKSSCSSNSTTMMETINRIDELDDNILLLILERIPWVCSISCEAVCKRWNTLMSITYYNRTYPWTCIIQLDHWASSWFYALTEIPLVGANNNLRLDFLPFDRPLVNHGRQNITLLASYENLLLCCPPRPWNQHKTSFYICDPIRRQYIELPPTTTQAIKLLEKTAIGFTVSHTNSNKDTNHHQCLIEPYCKFKLMYIPVVSSLTPNILTTHVFCSETGKWSEIKIKFPPITYPRVNMMFNFFECSNMSAVTLGSKLHWVDKNYVMAFDLTKSQRRLINLPEQSVQIASRLGVCRGRLCLSQLRDGSVLRVWNLDERGIWRLKHETCTRTLRFVGDINKLSTFSYVPDDPTLFEVLAFHPVDPYTLIMGYGTDIVVRCNLARGIVVPAMNWDYETRRSNVFTLFHRSASAITTTT